METLSGEAFDLRELEAAEADANGLHMYLSVGGFLLRGDERIQETIDGTAPGLTQIFHAILFQMFFSEMSGTYLC